MSLKTISVTACHSFVFLVTVIKILRLLVTFVEILFLRGQMTQI